VDGHFLRKSAKTRSWEKAQLVARDLERGSDWQEPEVARITIDQAVDTYLTDAKSRELAPTTLSKLETIFRRQFLSWLHARNLFHLDEVTTAELTLFRNDWKDRALAKKKKHERLIGFFWFCIRNGWLKRKSSPKFSVDWFSSGFEFWFS